MSDAPEPGLRWEGDDVVFQPRPTTDLRRFAGAAYVALLVGMLVTLVIQNDWTTVSALAAGALALSLLLAGVIAVMRARDPAWRGRDRNAPVVVPAALLAEVRDLNEADRRLDGVKLVRERTGLDLQAAAQVARAAGPT